MNRRWPMSVRTVRIPLVAAVALTIGLAVLHPTGKTPVAEADLGWPGGIAALPSSVPAVPGISNQGVPAIIGSRESAIVAVFCDDGTGSLPDAAGPCADPITLEMTRTYPTSGTPYATFAASGIDALVLLDNAGADMDEATGVVAVEVSAGSGVNEIVRVSATDDAGESRSVNIVVVDTILAWGPTGTVIPQGSPAFISYRCDVTGRVPLDPVSASIDPDADGSQGLDDMYDGYYTSVYDGIGPGEGYGSGSLVGDIDLTDTWCGGLTSSLFDDFVDFQTDLGVFSVDPLAASLGAQSSWLWGTMGYFYPPVLDYGCGMGKTVDVFDIHALSIWAQFLPGGGAVEGGCDIDGWRNSVVTTGLWASRDVGVATVVAQQGGGVSPPRTVNVTLIRAACRWYSGRPGPGWRFGWRGWCLRRWTPLVGW
jgi:hypothetical protein